jgi:iron(II)-dependent oxidoreductase
MRKRYVISSSVIAALVIAGSLALRPSAAQDATPGPGQATLNAAVDWLFTATAQAESFGTLALTAESALQKTATAASPVPTVMGTGTATATPIEVATLTDQARILTSTVASGETATAFFATVPDWAVDVATEMVQVDGGTFQMGTTPQEITAAVNQCVNEQGGNCLVEFGADSLPQHSVTVSAFEIERTEVTYQQYLVFLNALGRDSHLRSCDGQLCIVTSAEDENSNVSGGDASGPYRVFEVIQNFPVTGVTWYGAETYCRAIGRRLPTEAEWERAARGFRNFIYPWGDEWDASLAKTSISPDEIPGAMPVGSFFGGASSYGVLDMAGNVAEWVSDWYDPNYYSMPGASGLDPKGPPPSDQVFQKVVRGGSWDAKPFFARSVHRQSTVPLTTGAWLGFRCAADYTPPPMTPTFTPTAAAVQATPTIRMTSTPTVRP